MERKKRNQKRSSKPSRPDHETKRKEFQERAPDKSEEKITKFGVCVCVRLHALSYFDKVISVGKSRRENNLKKVRD